MLHNILWSSVQVVSCSMKTLFWSTSSRFNNFYAGINQRVLRLNQVVASHWPPSQAKLLLLPLSSPPLTHPGVTTAGRVTQRSQITQQRPRPHLPLSPKRGGCLKKRDREDDRNMAAERHHLCKETLVLTNLLPQHVAPLVRIRDRCRLREVNKSKVRVQPGTMAGTWKRIVLIWELVITWYSNWIMERNPRKRISPTQCQVGWIHHTIPCQVKGQSLLSMPPLLLALLLVSHHILLLWCQARGVVKVF